MADDPTDVLKARIVEDSEVLPPVLRERYVDRMAAAAEGGEPPPSAPPRPEPDTSPTPETTETRDSADTSAASGASTPTDVPSEVPAPPAEAGAEQDDRANELHAELTTLREELRRAQARYDTLRGKYDSEIAALRAQLAALNSAQQPARVSRPTTDEAPKADDVVRTLKEALAAQYGQEFDQTTIDFVARAAALAHEKAVAALQERLTATEQQTTLTRQQALELQLDTRIPGWRETAMDPQFASWLDEADPFSGLVRREVLAKAVERGDADRLAVVFETYRRTASSVPSSNVLEPPSTPRSTGAPPSSKPKLPPSVAVAPPRPRGPVAATSASTAPLVTSADLRAYAERIRRGEATDEEFRRIHEAILSGRYSG